ncbi:UvrD-helicase domain-containing protein [Paenibacillus sp. NPDC058177]|uniref:UvrD-helicase domain-containing protein n=1 Tax=Paenibacillus sp. NPDC058177 TaxID=3346369 RepID=UPI0036DCC819
MVEETVENIYLVNAPAGSGKTTTIKSMIFKHLVEYPNDNILCITYTNRAAEELGKDMDSKKVHFSTIHSFLHNFLKIYFSHEQIVNLYFEIYGPEIMRRISNEDGDATIIRSNERYIEKNGSLSFDVIKANLKTIHYNESQFNSLFYGGLSHDDLITFSKSVFEKFPVINRRLTKKYQLIFIDEYQDSSANVLKLFYQAVHATSTELYFLGDKMQQIYRNYDGSFEDKLLTLNKSVKLNTNYRSVPSVINILNKLYNNSLYKQEPAEKNLNTSVDHLPRIVLCDDMSEKLRLEKQNYPDALLLFLLNQKRFDSIGAGDLYRKYNNMERYSFIQQYSAVDVLINDSQDNPDILVKLLFMVNQIAEDYGAKSLGNIVQLFKRNPKIFNDSVFTVKKHEDKRRLDNFLRKISEVYNDTERVYSIKSVLNVLLETELVRPEYISSIIDDENYSLVLDVKLEEFRFLAQYLKTPNVSTQHGVKGESHDTVFFIAEDNNNKPLVHMYRFFKMWSSTEVSLNDFESFYYEYVEWINETISYLGFKLSEINSALHKKHQEYLESRINQLLKHFENNEYFQSLCASEYKTYLDNSIVTTAKKCFKESQVYGPLSAYRLFYVGCSRARRNLSIFIDKSKIEGFSSQLMKKFNETGFEIME